MQFCLFTAKHIPSIFKIPLHVKKIYKINSIHKGLLRDSFLDFLM